MSAGDSGISLPGCRLCRGQVHAFDFTRGFGAYDPKMSCAILLLKYGILAPLGEWFAAPLATLLQGEPQFFVADAVVPVPLADPAGERL